jgi:hypothetical protein
MWSTSTQREVYVSIKTYVKLSLINYIFQEEPLKWLNSYKFCLYISKTV